MVKVRVYHVESRKLPSFGLSYHCLHSPVRRGRFVPKTASIPNPIPNPIVMMNVDSERKEVTPRSSVGVAS